MNKLSKCLMLLGLGGILSHPIYAQELTEECGSKMSPAQEQIFLSTLKSRQQFTVDFTQKSQRSLPVQHHIIRRSNGTGGLDPAEIPNLMNELNTYYANANIDFYECSSVNFIDDDTYYDFQTSQESALASAHEVPNVINIYYANTVMSGSSSYCGYAYYPGGPDRILMKNSCALNGSTLIHEVGHFFSLRHTHGGTPNELVDGSNCATEGDYICDTPADPNLSGKVNTACQYTANEQDANGDTYVPDENNIMSYSRKSCRNVLTTGQYNSVAYSALNQRQNLGCNQGGGNCVATVSNFPYSEGFEASLGAWTNASGDDFDWTRRTGSTPSTATGPSSAKEGNYYIYTESSSPNYPSKTAIFESPCFDLTSVASPEFRFSYHMYGSAMGTLRIDVSSDGGANWTTGVLTKSGNQGNVWLDASVDLSSFKSNQVKIRLHVSTGSSYTSDVAIDYIAVGAKSACPVTVTNFMYRETFSFNNIGLWSQSTSDDTDWKVHSNGTPTVGTGPSSASHGSYYVYIESSYPTPAYAKAIIESPCFDVSNMSSPELRFDYHMYGANMGTLAVQVSEDGGQTWSYNVWYKSGDQSNGPQISYLDRIGEVIDPGFTPDYELALTHQEPWIEGVVDLGRYASSSLKVRFVGTTGSGVTSDMALDNIRVQSAPCTKTEEVFPYYENFETNIHGWTQETNDDISWTARQGSTPSSSTGPSAASSGLKYMYVEASGQYNKTAGFVSPCFDLEPMIRTSRGWEDALMPFDLVISFDYHMYGSTMGNLKMQISDDGGNSWVDKWSRSGNQGNYWRKQSITIYQYTNSNIRVRFMATTGSGYYSDIAIDNFAISAPINITLTEPAIDAGIENTTIKLYPNPSKGISTLNFGDYDSNAEIKVYNALGKLVHETIKQEGEYEKQLKLDHLPPGYYLVVISGDGLDVPPKKMIIN
ncbi:T9SS type A sorting domain-containing protein [Luteibaculum oceani]|uniref:T9SS type A sorting domain-containing protein n=1 Tax=Luteibaculum oceani TaxID=1294296 RepID=A0A5C6VBP9_9FLAO|nr:T9SS type A sorting domain-containing protein [Luteibaculum oceani]TXC82111.1 T9SS type A sorting domain-containing protein [Luteibaculum oceani]